MKRDAAFIQVNAHLLRVYPDRMAMALWMWYSARCPNKIIYKNLRGKKFGVSDRTLRRNVERMMHPKNGAPRLASRVKGSRHYCLWTRRHNEYVYSRLGLYETTKARHTVVVRKDMSVQDVYREIGKKIFQMHNAQIRHRRDPTVVQKGRELFLASGRTFDEHPSVKTLKPTEDRHHAPQPGKATSLFIGISERTWWRYVRKWEEEGALARKRRRLRLSGPPRGWNGDAVAFRERWGVGVFTHNNRCWYMQMPNLYLDLSNHRGDHTDLRRSIHRSYGKTTRELFTELSKSRVNAVK